MSGIKIANGTAASAEQTVDTNGNAHVVLPTTDTQAGFAALVAENDPGTLTGSRSMQPLEATQDFRLRVGVDTPVFDLAFEGTAVAQALISQTATGAMAAAQASGFLALNSGAITTTTTAMVVRTYRCFPLFGSYTTYVEFWAKPANESATNSVTEFGFGYVAGTTVLPTDGVMFRYNAGGQLMGVVNFAGTETTVNLTSPTTNQTHHYAIEMHNENTNFWINDALAGSIATPTSNPAPAQASQQPLFARIYNSGTASLARQLSIGKVSVSLGEANAAKPWGHVMNGMGGGSYQIQPGTASGPTLTRGASTTGWPTSGTAPATSGTFTATSAPAVNTLGGLWTTPAYSTMTSDADYPVFSYLNPVGTASLPGKTLLITGFRLGETLVSVAAATGVSTWRFALGIGSTSPNTTATEGVAVVAARIVPVTQFFCSATQAAGTSYPGVYLDFSSAPLVCPAGTYVQFIIRPSGVVTTNTLVLTGMATFMGYHE